MCEEGAKYLYNAINMETHGHLWNVTHQIIQPIVQPCQHIDRDTHISENIHYTWGYTIVVKNTIKVITLHSSLSI